MSDSAPTPPAIVASRTPTHVTVPYDAEVAKAQKTTRIILARHGEASYPSEIDSGAGGGTLTELGRSQAQALGHRLRDQEIAAVICSELSRARQTAEIAADILHLPVEVRPGLHEYQLGDEPYNLPSLGAALLAWLDGGLDARVLGGESGEEVASRILPVLDELAYQYESKTVLVVIHGGAIIATLGTIAPGKTGLPTDDDPRNLEHDIAGGTFFSLDHSPDGWRIVPGDVSP